MSRIVYKERCKIINVPEWIYPTSPVFFRNDSLYFFVAKYFISSFEDNIFKNRNLPRAILVGRCTLPSPNKFNPRDLSSEKAWG